MPKAFLTRLLLLATTVLGAAGCTVHQAEPPTLEGPSEYALSFRLAATPDAISQDGGSQSAIVVSAFDASGSPKSAVAFRLDMVVSGTPADYGTLSGKTIVTGSDGKASAIYTAPPPLPVGTNLPTCSASPFSQALPGGCIAIVATPMGSNFSTGRTQSVEIHLIPPGVILPPAATPTASFTVTPNGPAANTPVQFDASASCAGPLQASGGCPEAFGPLVSYDWEFSDGGKAAGKLVSHSFGLSQTYSVTLTVTNDRGVKASSTKQVSVGAGNGPTADFVFSPSPVVKGQNVSFDGSLSHPGLGHTISGYKWNWGDGDTTSTSSSPLQDHDYQSAGAFTVVLTVTDDAGQSATASKSVTVGTATAPGAPNVAFVSSPSAPLVGQQVNFDASQSSAASGHTISQYKWNFGDGSGLYTSASALATHTYTAAGAYSVTLTLTDDTGQTSTKSQTVTVGAATPPGAPAAAFISSPTAPVVGQTVNFNASQSTAASGHSLTQYRWTWGDGTAVTTSASPLTTHAFTSAGTYTITLTVTDDAGQTNTVSQSLTIGVIPTAAFTSSPSAPGVSQQVNFDASASTAAPGHSITNYQWNFGDGSALASGASPLATHSYSAAGTYTVTLTVTDNAGQKGTKTGTVAVAAGPTANFVVSTPASPVRTINVNASQSTAAPGHSISTYSWNWGDGSTDTGITQTHTYAAAGTYNVVLTVTDDAGQTGTKATSVTIP